jgi:glycosyltransferase involved in cell wall biosynthesis
MRRATRHLDAFLGASEFTIRMHWERGLRGMMIHLPIFYPRPVPLRDAQEAPNAGRPYFLFAGRLEKIKGVQITIPVFRGLPEVDLLIAGTGDFESELRLMAAGAANIRFLGHVDHTRLQALYRGAIATVVPSLCYETFALIVAESFSAATPVVAYAQSSVEELVRTHGGGLLYRIPDELRAAILELRTNQTLRERLGHEGRVAYETEFAEEAFLSRYVSVTRTLLDQKRAGVVADARGVDPRTSLLAGRQVFFAGEA